MGFNSKWLDWGKEREPEQDSSVSSVSSSDTEKPEKRNPGTHIKRKEKEKKGMPRTRAREIYPDTCFQRTDKTDRTPPAMIDGHRVEAILWETTNCIVFRDEAGQMWRRVHSWNTTWKVEVSNERPD